MTRAEQRQFVHDLTKTVKDKILANIKAGKVPADWNGVELRHLLADNFRAETRPMTPKDRRAYNNTVVVNNL